MRGLSEHIRLSLDTIIKGLEYDFISSEQKLDDIEPERMKSLANSKLTSLNSAKKIINRWIDSPNRPSDKVIIKYISDVVNAADSSLNFLRQALSVEINFDELDPHKHESAINAKPVILEAILDIDKETKELRDKIDNKDLNFKEVEFSLGYPERFAKGEFINRTKYYKKRLTEEGAVIIDPLSTEGEKIVIDDLEIVLPKKPTIGKILFSKRKKKDQYWRRPEIPNISTSNIEDYHKFIVEEYRRRMEGVWFMNNGVPTYITGHHYFALTYCKMFDNGGFMNYREAQRDLFYFMEACLVDPRCLGLLFGKSRRTGFTYCAIASQLNRATTTPNSKHGLMSKTGEDGKEVFAKISYAFQNLPFWIRPIVRGKIDSPSDLYFAAPADNSKAKKKSKEVNIDDYLNTSVDWRNTANGSYDSVKLNSYLLDEVFKIAPRLGNVITHLGMVTPTMMPNGRVVGKMLAGSTMGVHSQGGEQGVELIKNSHVSKRDPLTNKTPTGLYFHFLPAQNNMEEFTDKYGKCWIQKPEEEVLNVFGEPILEGSLDYLLAMEKQSREQSENAYNQHIRNLPRNIQHLMRDEATECVFNMEKLNEQIDYNETLKDEQKYTVGNFEWVLAKDGDVEFRPNPNGRFKVAWLPSAVDETQDLKNRVKEVRGKFFPLNTNCVKFGCDPFSYKSTHGKGSKGGLHGKTVFLPDGGAPSNQFVVEYLARPSDDHVFFEDVIKCIRFYGAPILVESNRLDLLRHLYNRGYRGFCIDRLDRPKHKLNPNEVKYGGQMMSGSDIIDSHINAIGTWVQNYVGVYRDTERKLRPLDSMGEMPFNETLVDWLKFDPSNRTDYDATISSGLAIMACDAHKYIPKSKPKKKVNMSAFFPKYKLTNGIGVKTRPLE